MQTKRIVYIDAIKVFLTCLVVAHHAGQAYGPTGGVWPVTDSSKTNWLGQFFFVNASYMMGLYFFISGYFIVFSLQRKTSTQFIKERLLRLGIPLLFFTFFVFLPFNYMESDKTSNIIHFFVDTYFNKPPLAVGHLWFVASLLAYSLIYIFLFFRKNSAAQSTTEKPFRLFYIFVYIFLLSIVSAWLRLQYPIDVWRTWLIPVEVAHIPQYVSMFLIGILFNRNQWLDKLELSSGLIAFAIAIIIYVVNIYLPIHIRNYRVTESLTESLLCVGISMALLTFFRHFGNKSLSIVRSLSENAYGIYLFHVFLVIALQKLLLNWEMNPNLKFFIVTFLGIALSFGISDALRRFKVIRAVI